jgi:hypothetical protein
LKKVARFSPRKTSINAPRFTTHFTTISPQKTTFCTALFAKHPLKIQQKEQNPGSRQGLIFF